MHPDRLLTVTRLLLSNKKSLLAALILGLLASLAAVLLLALAGWFVSASVLALVVTGTFAYYLPALILRSLTLVRTLASYGYQLVAHNHLLAMLAAVRVWLWQQFGRWHYRAHYRLGERLDYLLTSIEQINKLPLLWLLPAICVSCVALLYLIIAWYLLGHYALIIWLIVTVQLIVMPWLARRLLAPMLSSEQLAGRRWRANLLNYLSLLVTLTLSGASKNKCRQLRQELRAVNRCRQQQDCYLAIFTMSIKSCLLCPASVN